MQVKTVLIIEGCVNLLILAMKLTAGLITGSIALISDAMHSLGDFGNNIVAYIAHQVSMQAEDDNHHYGHHKAEQLAVFTLAILLIVVAIEIVINTVRQHGSETLDSQFGLIIMSLVLVVNVALTSWQHYWAKRLDSEILAADAKHTLADVLTSVAAITGWQMAVIGFPWVESVVALSVAALIVYFAVSLLRRSIAFLMDYSELSRQEIHDCVMEIDDVVEVDKVRARTLHDKSFADLTIKVDANLSTEQAHQVSDVVESRLQKKCGIDDVIVHVEPANQ